MVIAIIQMEPFQSYKLVGKVVSELNYDRNITEIFKIFKIFL